MTLSCLDPAAGVRPLELADIVAAHGSAYQSRHYVTPLQARVLADIERCRTAALGGTLYGCAGCGFRRYVYLSCRNRHCPKCQSLVKARWLEARMAELLPVPYFHNVFTLPHELNPLILWNEANQRLLLNLLFRAASQTLLTFGKNNLGGKLGFTMVLHTWDQQLRPHFHVHAVVAAGALADDGWIPASSRFLFAVRALSKVFRAKYLDGLTELLQQNQLQLPPTHAHLLVASKRRAWLRPLRRKGWVVYSKAPFAGPEKLLDYLGRYTHKTAIANHRLVAMQGDQVTFKWRDRANGDQRKLLTLPAEEFLSRFLCHVLPSGFMRIRHFGFLANRSKQQALAACREHLQISPPPAEEKSMIDLMLELTGVDITACPHCGTQLQPILFVPDSDGSTKPALFDSS